MSGKNRALGLAIATAALVGFSAPMASAATIAGPSNSGFNNDSILNLSNNQLPVQTCTFGAAANTAPLTQAITGAVDAALGASTGDLTATQNSTCTNGGTQNNSSTTNTGSSNMGGGAGAGANAVHDWSNNSGPSNSGFNNDSILNLSGNQVPVQTCTFGALSNAASIIQTLAPVVAPVLAPTDLTDITAGTGDVNGSQTASCSQAPSQTETSSLAS